MPLQEALSSAEGSTSDTGHQNVLRLNLPDSSAGRLLDFPLEVVRSRLSSLMREGVVSLQPGSDGGIDLILSQEAERILERGDEEGEGEDEELRAA